MKNNMIIILVIIFLVIITNDYIKSKAAVYMQSENINNNGLNTMKIKYFPETRYELRKLVCNESIKLWEIDTSKITDMYNLFYQSERKDFTGIEDWNVSNVKDMSGMFKYTPINHNLNKWNVSKVENMHKMFLGAVTFNSDISKWNVSQVEDMLSMFANALSFNQDISKWNVSKVKNMSDMFAFALSFNKDLSKW